MYACVWARVDENSLSGNEIEIQRDPNHENNNKQQALRIQTYPGLKLMSHFPKCHILLNAIHAILELHSGHIYIGNHRTDITCVSESKGKMEMKGAIETNFVTNLLCNYIVLFFDYIYDEKNLGIWTSL